jgi:uncharacterized FAD-dependent dehydrogenase
MRYRVTGLHLWVDEDPGVLAGRAAARLGVEPGAVRDLEVVRRSLDARRKGHPRWVIDAEASLESPLPSLPAGVQAISGEDRTPRAPVRPPDLPPVILGAGPAGLFCAHALLERGVRSIVVDRGRTVQPRRRDVARLLRTGDLDPESNMNFGEGGAGAYTDGKLSTRIHNPMVRRVVELFARHGRAERILVEGKPHVGSDVLPAAVSAMREELERGGVEFLWEARAVDVELAAGRVRALRLADGRSLPCDRLVLAPGNSARELYERFAERGWPIEAKPFAVGFRVEHPQALIDRIQYGAAAGRPGLPPADYRLADSPDGGGARGVFSFCMCPGGVVVPTPTEPGLQCTNGMSNSSRSSPLANAGLVVAVSPADFAAEGFEGPLAGLEWQRKWERSAFELGGGGYRAPAQRLADWLAGRPGSAPGRTSYRPGVTHADLSRLFPSQVQDALRAALRAFDRRMRGFVTSEALLLGVETRTSAPCRLLRGDDLQSPALRGVYPAGEGAGYAGGIVSSAVDGLKVAEAICRELGG